MPFPLPCQFNPAPGENFNAAPAPTLLYSEPSIFKGIKFSISSGKLKYQAWKAYKILYLKQYMEKPVPINNIQGIYSRPGTMRFEFNLLNLNLNNLEILD
jgi:hypothetical protein